jgi:hypothetical protein
VVTVIYVRLGQIARAAAYPARNLLQYEGNDAIPARLRSDNNDIMRRYPAQGAHEIQYPRWGAPRQPCGILRDHPARG